MVLICKSLSLLHPRMLCVKFGWNWSCGSEEQDFKNFFSIFLLFRNYLSFEKGVALHLNKLEFPLPKDALCQVWLKLAQRFWRRFLNFVNVFSLFCNIFLWKKDGILFIEQTWIPVIQRCFVPNLVEIGWMALEKKSKMWKVYRQTDGQTDIGRQVIRKAHLSFQFRWAENNTRIRS